MTFKYGSRTQGIVDIAESDFWLRKVPILMDGRTDGQTEPHSITSEDLRVTAELMNGCISETALKNSFMLYKWSTLVTAVQRDSVTNMSLHTHQ